MNRVQQLTQRRLYATVKADYTHVVVGGGAVGLAIARRLADKPGTSTLLIERRGAVGTETSSRNSGVIHAGIYYGPDSLKTSLCIKGKHMLYDLCARENIPHRNTQKWILAQNDDQVCEIQKTYDFAKSIGVPMRFVPSAESKAREPEVRAESVLESTTTGIVDSHAYMAFLESDFQSKGGDLACHTTVTGIEPGWKIRTRSGSAQEESVITAETLINSAGLGAISLSNSILPAERHLVPYFAKGSYYSYSAPHPKPRVLLYPAPQKGLAGLGTHLTIDLAGQIRFGPDVEWVDDPNDVSVNESGLEAALNAIETYLPSIQRDKIQLDYCGIRPKLGKGSAVSRGKGDEFSDFVIRREEGCDGFINLLGIESPGLTSSLAIADMTHDLLYR